MKNRKILCILFVLAGCCFLAGTVNHLLRTKEGIVSSALLAAGCFCAAYAFRKK